MAKVVRVTQLDSYPKKSGIFESLVSSIVSQQLSVKAASTIYGRFYDLCKKKVSPKKVLSFTVEELRSVGLSRQKAGYVHNIATFFSNRKNARYQWDSAEPAEIVDKLTEIKGVGKWTVQMVMMFQLDLPDIFPVGDLGIQQKMMHLYNLDGNKKEIMQKMEKIADNWSPCRTIASKYLWKYEITVNE